ncbi:diguanylate cyclase (GGDEF) domain-containing protein [Altererythrobacter xiamenensis]|uniref:Diguanylate cyclase (GGDEF) domain-containing protein n=1 Tax=Altererythrobacter xiamenensis TaxID=1316679 RepID=A0A1Y6EKV6_9SPHN|nr:EAL domain-containing protein [Altererythrobacter xiamenensis]SMQ63255.1 diguanylate cyclase (GGDEF) domain-containing protein [Altererythrobacter xiamenensis]
MSFENFHKTFSSILKNETTQGVTPTISDFSVLREIEQVGVGCFWATDSQGKLIYLSENAKSAFEEEGCQIIGRPMLEFFQEAGCHGAQSGSRSLAFRIQSRSSLANLTVKINSRPDQPECRARYWRICGAPLFDDEGHFKGYRGNAADTTGEFHHQREVTKQSQFDELTGLSNRRRLNEKLSGILESSRGRCCALMMLDLDRFKQVNDTMGHPAGDELLQQVGDRLRVLIKNRGEVGRLGGDEFQILLPDLDDRGELSELADRVIQMLSQPYSINGRRAIIGTSVGIAIAPFDGITAAELISSADMALYRAKEDGRGVSRFYTAELRNAANLGVRLEEDLRDAIDKGELSLAYQPLVDPTDNRVKCFEALMRWEHPHEGTISPGVFIPIAEKSELILILGEWALRQACRDAAQWPDHIHVAVNVSARQFMQADMPKLVSSALRSSSLAASRLELEVTESVFVGGVEAVDQTFDRLDRLGVRLAMDDFGTGYSSLGYLKRAPFKKIKIDQSFVQGCTESGDTNPAIISAVVALAKALGMQTVAEGVEAMDELALVRERGADLIQGYIYSPPLTQDQILTKFADGDWILKADGPPRYRADRMTLYRKAGLIHEDHYYEVMLRNLSKTGARIEGLRGVPIGTDVVLDLGAGQLVVSKVIHTTDRSQGLRFETSLISDGYSGLMARHRVSPYLLAEAGMPLAALGQGNTYPVAKTQGPMRPPKFVQLDLAH